MKPQGMTFRDWQQLTASEAAHEVHHRIRTLLTPQQQRAAIATLPDEASLVTAFSRADRSAPLGGVPCFLKDLFDVAGTPTFAGSAFLPEVRGTPQTNSAIVQAMESCGAVIVGKTHLHEFAYGVTGENPHYGDCEHPRFPGRTTGGSSSGSAALVAAGIVPFAIGTDTGGSVRIPAAFCNLFGFRLTPKDRLIADAFPLAPSFDTAGWFTGSAHDMRIAIESLVGSDEIVGEPRGLYLEMPDLDPDVADVCLHEAERFAPAVDSLSREELLQGFVHSSDIYNRIVAHEAWAVHAPWAERFKARYDPAVWERLNRVHTVSQAELDQAYAGMAAVRARWNEYFRSYNFLVMAATPFGALLKADCTLTNRLRILQLTAPASLGGLPVLTIPVPLASGLTTGLQIILKHPRSAAAPWVLNRIVERQGSPSSS
jgi:amidase/aspartyl-tRNA(Asn)/glutamyl-tRNA(Gln) amidotransferase subunit A